MSKLTANEKLLRRCVDEEIGFRSKLVRKFIRFHHRNPRVYQLLEQFSARAASRRRAFGMSAIFERIRWEYNIETDEDTHLKLNNNYRAYYARLLMMDHPEYKGLFKTRALGSNGQIV